MKFLILLALVAVATAIPHAAIISTGHSSQHRSQDNHGNYAFGYNENHKSGGTFREEKGDGHGNKMGSYGLVDADGRKRTVNYVADAHGFRASIKTNEPGTTSKDTAAASYNGADIAHIAAPIIAAAPIAHAGYGYGAGYGAGYGKALIAAPAAPIAHYGGAYGAGYGGAYGAGYGHLGGAAYSMAINHGAVVAHSAPILAKSYGGGYGAGYGYGVHY